MVYKLLVELSIHFTDKKFESILAPRDMVRSEPLVIDYVITNIGDEDFAGGIFEDTTADFSDLHLFRKPKIEIPKIEKNTQKKIYEWGLILIGSGLVWFGCKITAKDGKPIEFYQIPESSGGVPVGRGNEWRNYYMVLDREKIESLYLLKSIDEKLGKLLAKK